MEDMDLLLGKMDRTSPLGMFIQIMKVEVPKI
jgi:hypothetical protein